MKPAIKQNALCWWNLKSESNKCKWPDKEMDSSMPPDTASHTPPNLRVQFKKKYYNGGYVRLYDP